MSRISFIHDTVSNIIKKFDTRDPFNICSNMNIHIYYKDLGSSLKAYYFYHSRIKNIIINVNSQGPMTRVLCAHELGHAMLHNNPKAVCLFKETELFDATGLAEYEANLFAADLLIPDSELLSLMVNPDKTVFNIAQEFYVPVELLEFKLQILKSKGLFVNLPDIANSNFLKKTLPANCVSSLS
ncbi:MAG: ImmA/IrrE family metallo-endopeptidase [Ruminococcaceae bacterium]|nr:ImmA/IrrE family metallo-endopeptidase [Oscillospiraceae bacterium]